MTGIILAIGAHPDDIEIGCGGTLKKLIDRGTRVYGVVLTKGQNGQHATDCHECGASLKSLGVRETHILDFKDGYINFDAGVVSAIEKFVKQYEPEEIYGHSIHDRHQDHMFTGYATIAAARKSPKIYLYQSPSSTSEFSPTSFSVITKNIEDKINALGFYSSQLERDSILDLDWVRAEAIYWGHKSLTNNGKKDFVEAFEMFREVRR